MYSKNLFAEEFMDAKKIRHARDKSMQLIPAVELPSNFQTGSEMVKNWVNCKEACIDTDGGIWIEYPQSGHWLSDEEIASFIDWCENVYQIQFKL
jgi:hypothetical protein